MPRQRQRTIDDLSVTVEANITAEVMSAFAHRSASGVELLAAFATALSENAMHAFASTGYRAMRAAADVSVSERILSMMRNQNVPAKWTDVRTYIVDSLMHACADVDTGDVMHARRIEALRDAIATIDRISERVHRRALLEHQV